MGKNKNFTLRLFRCKIFLNVKYFTCKKFYCKIFDHKIFSSVWNDKTRENATHHLCLQYLLFTTNVKLSTITATRNHTHGLQLLLQLSNKLHQNQPRLQLARSQPTKKKKKCKHSTNATLPVHSKIYLFNFERSTMETLHHQN